MYVHFSSKVMQTIRMFKLKRILVIKKFLGLIIDNNTLLSWNNQINQLVTKLGAASYSIRTLSFIYI
jgi:hypothetical protein